MTTEQLEPIANTEDLKVFNRMRIMLRDELNLSTFPKMNVTRTEEFTVLSIVIPKS